VVKAIIDFARDKGVSKVIVGRTHQPRWRRWLKATSPRDWSPMPAIST